MAASPIDKITKLLSSDAPEKRIAAAIVLAELKPRGAPIVKALGAALDDGGPALQRRALEALAVIGARKALPQILPLLAARDGHVRNAAVNAVVSVGDVVLPQISSRFEEANADERRALDTVLARLGGKQAFSTLLDGLEDADEEQANAAAIAMRAQVRDADGKSRRSYFSQLQKVLTRQEKKKRDASVAVTRAALKMLGYLEDARALPTLQKYAASKKQPASVRQEALIALRFTHQGRKPDAKMLGALIGAAAADDRALAQTALITLAGLDLPDRTAGRLDPLIAHPDIERAKFVIDMLSHRKSDDAAAQLVQVIAEHDVRRGKLAADALAHRKDAAAALVTALAACNDRERARMLAKVLHPWAGELKPSQRKKLLTVVAKRLEKGEQGWQSPFDIADAANPKDAAKALRALFEKLKRRKPPELATQVLRLLCKSDQATQDDRYLLASRLLASSHKNTSSASRRGDDTLREIERLLREGYDVVKRLEKDRTIDLEALYYLGFHFIEKGYPAGGDLLERVVDAGGRKKIAKMAKNKLRLSGRAA
jgi:HEAT repeat protein